MDRRWRYLLIGSMVLNIFLLGAGAGYLLSGAAFRSSGGGGRRPMFNLWAASRDLPAPDRERFRQAMHDRAVGLQPQIMAARQARRHAADLISAPQYDAAAIGAALTEARQDEVQVRSTMDTAFVSAVAVLPVGERASLAAAMMRGGRHGGRIFHRDDGGDGPPPPPPQQ